MKINKITTATTYYIEIQHGPYRTTDYRTSDFGSNWEVGIGESWEPCFHEESELRSAFLAFVHNETKPAN